MNTIKQHALYVAKNAQIYKKRISKNYLGIDIVEVHQIRMLTGRSCSDCVHYDICRECPAVRAYLMQEVAKRGKSHI